MASDTSLVFSLVAKERISEELGKAKERISTAAAGIGAGAAAALGAGLLTNLDMEAAGDKLAAQLGVGPEKAAELSKVSANVFKQAWGDSIETVSDAVKGVYQNIGDTSTAQGGIEGLTTKALALAQTFDQEVGMTTAAVGQMMKTGLAKNADEAFDIITAGFQAGVNKSDDFLETLNEYGTQFRKFGLDGQTATGLLAQGLKAGARDADVVADAIKEFSIRAIDGSTTTADGFKAIGLSADQMAAKIGKGGSSASAALDLTLDRLRAIKDPVQREAAAVALFGTQAEDLGKALYSLDPSKAVATLGKVGGAADRMAKTVGDNPKAAIERFKRAALAELGEIGGAMAKWAIENEGKTKALAITLGVIAGLIVAIKAGMILWTAAQTAWTAATTIATGVQWLWNAALAANPIGLIILAVVGLVAAIVVLWKKNEGFRNFFKKAWSAIWSAMKGVFSWAKDNWPLILGILTGPIGWATLAITKNWDKIKEGGKKALDWITGIPDKISRGFSRIGEILYAPFRWGFNLIARGWNATIGRLQITVPSWVPGLGGASWGMPDIPYLARGGRILAPGLAMVGEAGPEIVHLPAGATVAPLGRGGGGMGVVRVVIDVRGADREMTRLIRKIVRVDGRGSPETAFGRR